MDKAPDAFRTISEVAEVLDTPAHVLRFWESRFPQIRPIKRAGGRRYYRPADVALLAGIRHLLHDQGLTIRGVQKVLRENGVRHVQALSQGLMDGLGAPGEAAGIEAALDAEFLTGAEPERLVLRPEAQVVPLHQTPRGRKPDGDTGLRADAPPAPAEEVPEAPFIEAEEETPAPSAPVPLHRPKPPAPVDDLPLLARMAEGPTAEELRVLAATDGVILPEDAPPPEDLADLAAPDGAAPDGAAAREPALPPLATRLRALRGPLAADRAATLAKALARARALRARMGPPRPRG
jgi:DNA-binding transcriptional MerR regulator